MTTYQGKVMRCHGPLAATDDGLLAEEKLHGSLLLVAEPFNHAIIQDAVLLQSQKQGRLDLKLAEVTETVLADGRA